VETLQPDPDTAAAFYGELFGWELVGPAAPGSEAGGTPYRVGRLEGRDVAGIVPLPPGVTPPPAPGWMTHVRVDRVEAAADRVVAAGGSVVFGPFDAVPAGRLGVMADPAGAVFAVWEADSREGAQLVNAPGAWAMSRLETPDPQSAAAFYATVFGWTTERFGTGAGEVVMFRLPGYVGGEPAQPVSREVVAVMTASPSAGAVAAWHVDFWVDDVDAAVTSASALGGRTLVAPLDQPPGRTAVLADPAGAAFSVSQIG